MRTAAGALRAFIAPRPSRRLAVRLGLVAAVAFVLFRFVLRPAWVSGSSMEPTYRDGSLTFVFRLRFLLREPRVGEVVAVRLSGTRVMLLKRVVARSGDTVEFRAGTLCVNGVPQAEPYVAFRGTWDLPPRQVKPGQIYVVGDNRGVPMQTHQFGQTAKERIVGAPLW
jgi:signal peptidase I